LHDFDRMVIFEAIRGLCSRRKKKIRKPRSIWVSVHSRQSEQSQWSASY